MTEPFESARAKLGRAKEHLETLNKETNRFFRKNPYPVTREANVEQGQYLFRVHIKRQADWQQAGLLIGDCIHNLRSALDHIVWELAAETADSSTEFPIFKDRSEAKGRIDKKIRRVSRSAGAVLKCLQPYRTRDPLSDPLWAIHDFDIADKHHVVVAGASILDESAIRFRVPPFTHIQHHTIISIGAFEDGTAIGEATISPPNPKVKVEGDFSFGVAFSKSGGVGERLYSAKMDLANMIAKVDRILDLFTRLRPRL